MAVQGQSGKAVASAPCMHAWLEPETHTEESQAAAVLCVLVCVVVRAAGALDRESDTQGWEASKCRHRSSTLQHHSATQCL